MAEATRPNHAFKEEMRQELLRPVAYSAIAFEVFVTCLLDIKMTWSTS